MKIVKFLKKKAEKELEKWCEKMYFETETREFDKKAEKRKPIIGSILYTNPLISRKNKYFEGLTVSVGESGVRIYLSHRLEEGLQIDVYGKALGDSKRKAIVIWCEKIDEDVYCADLSLTKE